MPDGGKVYQICANIFIFYIDFQQATKKKEYCDKIGYLSLKYANHLFTRLLRNSFYNHAVQYINLIDYHQ